MKKKISIATITCVVISALIAILALFGIFKLKGIITTLLFTSLTLTISGILTINSFKMVERKNKMAITSLSLIFLSTLLVILCFWTKLDKYDAFLNLTLISCVVSICFNLITSSILKLRKNYKSIQCISYICYVAVSLYLILAFLKVIKLDGRNIKSFILFIILSFVAMCVLTVLSKKQPITIIENKEYIKISKEEYADLISKKQQLEILLKERKQHD